MPPVRQDRNITTSVTPATFTFAPNVTPRTFIPDHDSSPNPQSASSDSSRSAGTSSPSPTTPPPTSLLSTSSTTRRRQPPNKRRSLGYIPRPPNAFMLFRADFVRQKHVPGSIETNNHGSLSKIIGNCWRALGAADRAVWEAKAREAKAEHKARWPEYRFRPVHNKEKKMKARQAAAKAAAQALSIGVHQAAQASAAGAHHGLDPYLYGSSLPSGAFGDEYDNEEDEDLDYAMDGQIDFDFDGTMSVSGFGLSNTAAASQLGPGAGLTLITNTDAGSGSPASLSSLSLNSMSGMTLSATSTEASTPLNVPVSIAPHQFPVAVQQDFAYFNQQQQQQFMHPHQQFANFDFGGSSSSSSNGVNANSNAGFFAPVPSFAANNQAQVPFDLNMGFTNANANMNMNTNSFYPPRRPSSVPLLPTNSANTFGFGQSFAPGPSVFNTNSHAHIQSTVNIGFTNPFAESAPKTDDSASADENKSGIAIPSLIPIPPLPSSTAPSDESANAMQKSTSSAAPPSAFAMLPGARASFLFGSTMNDANQGFYAPSNIASSSLASWNGFNATSNASANGFSMASNANGFNFNTNSNSNFGVGIGLRRASSTQPVLMRHLWSTNKVAAQDATGGLGLDLHASAPVPGAGSGSPVLETRVEGQGDEDSASQASNTPTQAVPNANASIETRVEDADEYRFNSRESFNFTRIFDALPSATDVETSISSTNTVPSSTTSNAESSTTAAPSLIAPVPTHPFQGFDSTEPNTQPTAEMSYSDLTYGSMDMNLGMAMYPPDVDHTSFGSMGVGMGIGMEYGPNRQCVFEDGQFGFAGVGAAVEEY